MEQLQLFINQLVTVSEIAYRCWVRVTGKTDRVAAAELWMDRMSGLRREKKLPCAAKREVMQGHTSLRSELICPYLLALGGPFSVDR